jgi:hypothetical protein
MSWDLDLPVVVLTVMACGHDGVVGGSRICLLGYFGL